MSGEQGRSVRSRKRTVAHSIGAMSPCHCHSSFLPYATQLVKLVAFLDRPIPESGGLLI